MACIGRYQISHILWSKQPSILYKVANIPIINFPKYSIFLKVTKILNTVSYIPRVKWQLSCFPKTPIQASCSGSDDLIIYTKKGSCIIKKRLHFYSENSRLGMWDEISLLFIFWKVIYFHNFGDSFVATVFVEARFNALCCIYLVCTCVLIHHKISYSLFVKNILYRCFSTCLHKERKNKAS